MLIDPTTGLGPAAIAATAGAILSLLFNYIPGLNTAFDKLSADMQRMAMGVVILLTAIGMAVWQCSEDGNTMLAYCRDNSLNWRAVLTNAVFALIGNQSADRISPKPRADEAGKVRAATDIPPRASYPPGRYPEPPSASPTSTPSIADHERTGGHDRAAGHERPTRTI